MVKAFSTVAWEEALRGFTYAIEIIKLDTVCRIGEVFAFKVSDYATWVQQRKQTEQDAVTNIVGVLFFGSAPQCPLAVSLSVSRGSHGVGFRHRQRP